ncbi:MAG TPA: hypothetical protein VMV49_02915 [Candidatus Deferrimicrobium sp.]|nr:hypothetical protein [Candidatus Deferrimicrobium sp.]
MGVINYGYFLYGIFLFFMWRLFHLLSYFKRTPYPVPGRSSVWFFIFGSGYLLVLINIFQNANFTYGFDYLIIIPAVLIILALINLIGESFVAPTKNYLIALGLGVLIGTITLICTRLIFTGGISSYLQLIPFLLGLLVGGIAGLVIYKFLLKPHYPNWNTTLWHLHKFWDIFNHSAFLVLIAILAFIEATLQLKSTSLFYFFTSL